MVARIHGELLSVGFKVDMADRPSHGPGTADFRSWLVGLVDKRDVDAIVDVVGDLVPVAVDVWVVAEAPDRFELSRLPMEQGSDNASEKLAIRAVEVLRSRFLEMDLAAREKRSDTVSTRAAAVPVGELDGAKDAYQRLGIALGAGALSSLDGVGPSLLPIALVEWSSSSGLVLNAALAGFGSRATVATNNSSAQIAEQFALLGGRYRFRPQSRLKPFVSLAAGVLHTSVEGTTAPPKEGHSVQRWSFLLETGGGAELRLPGQYYVIAAAHVQVALPYVAVYFGDEVVGSSGRPNLLLSLAVGAWL